MNKQYLASVHAPDKSVIALPFSEKYDAQHAEHYFTKHQRTLARRLSHWRDTQVARQALALAGNPASVLDLPCGAGRFWPLLAERADREIYAADNSQAMMDRAEIEQPAAIVARVKMFQSSVFAIQTPSNFVDCVFCIRLLHHVAQPADRMALLRELHRVTRDTVVVSLWVDGNLKSWQRARLERRRAARGKSANRNRFVLQRDVAQAEFAAAGFDIVAHVDFLPGYAMWRTYVLRKQVLL